jgi:hypothetical protein
VNPMLLVLGAAGVAIVVLGVLRIRLAIGDRDADGAFIGAIVACAGLLAAVTATGPGFLGGLG